MTKVKKLVINVVLLGGLMVAGGVSLFGCSILDIFSGRRSSPESLDVQEQKQPISDAPLPNLPLPGK